MPILSEGKRSREAPAELIDLLPGMEEEKLVDVPLDGRRDR
jgi:hypothetical protein